MTEEAATCFGVECLVHLDATIAEDAFLDESVRRSHKSSPPKIGFRLRHCQFTPKDPTKLSQCQKASWNQCVESMDCMSSIELSDFARGRVVSTASVLTVNPYDIQNHNGISFYLRYADALSGGFFFFWSFSFLNFTESLLF